MQKINFFWARGKAIVGEDYLLQMIVPNVYSHVGMV
jgi:hypothetical protein